MACIPDPEHSWPLWSITTHGLESPGPRVPFRCTTDKPHVPTQLTPRVHTAQSPAQRGGPCSFSKRGSMDSARCLRQYKECSPLNHWVPLSRAKHAERSCVLPPSDEALVTHRAPQLSCSGEAMGLFPTCFAPVLDWNNLSDLFLIFLRSRAAQERLKPDDAEEHKQACR